MSLSINNQIGTDRQKARATEFINRNDRDITKMAVRSYNITHAESERKLNNRLKTATAAIPVAAFASGLILKKGIKSSLKHTANWGMLLAAPIVVHDIGRALSKPDAHGKKHDNMPFGIGLGLSLAGYLGGVTALNKISQNKKVNSIADTIITGANETFNKLRKDIKIPENISAKFAEIKSNIKMPKFIKPYIETAKNSENLGKIVKGTKNIAKKALKHSPDIMLFSVLGVALGAAIKQGVEISSRKSQIKNAQLETARTLVNVYAEENKALKNS